MTLVANSGSLSLVRSLGGATASVAVGTLTAGTPFRAALVVRPGGQASACLDGGAVATLSGGWQTLRIGGEAAGANALFG